ncbi:MAG: hypothetical protein M1833_003451 [Piccolia ochrophora]|nr:MAG: hypothetical protein M1833_003451 [Piccolia ochrophora]
MASTRSATGNSRPRVFAPTEPATNSTKRSTKKSGAGRPKAAAKPTTKKSGSGASGRVSKAKAPATQHKRKSSLADKIEGAVLKAEGKVTGREGKKAAGTKKVRGTDGKNAKTTTTTKKR